jgi:mono-ADP-ribosyltransferase sirtuin 6
MSCNYAEGLSEYENKGRLGAPEKFDTADEVTEKVDQLVQLFKQAKHIGRAPVQTPEI